MTALVVLILLGILVNFDDGPTVLCGVVGLGTLAVLVS